jgi:hypothetical protein
MMMCSGSNDGMELNMSLEDLLSAEQRGKWWLVGSAWQGRTLQPATMGKYIPYLLNALLQSTLLEATILFHAMFIESVLSIFTCCKCSLLEIQQTAT